MGAGGAWLARLVPAFWRVHRWQVVGAFDASGPAEGWLWSFGGAFPAFCLFAAFAFLQYLLNMPLFRILRRFLAGFGVLVWVCVALVVCVACVAFVRVSG